MIAIVLARPGHALDEEVPARQEGDDHPLQEVVLADDDLLDLVEHPLHRARAPASWSAMLVLHAGVGSAIRVSSGGQAGGAAGHVDRHGEADPDEDVLRGRVDQRGDDADDLAVPVEQRAARVARVDRRVDLDEAVQDGPSRSGPGTSGRARTRRPRYRAVQAERVADDVRLAADLDARGLPRVAGTTVAGGVAGAVTAMSLSGSLDAISAATSSRRRR